MIQKKIKKYAIANFIKKNLQFHSEYKKKWAKSICSKQLS